MFRYFKENPVCVSLKHEQHFDEHTSNQKHRKKERKNIFNLQLLRIHATLRSILKINEFILINY